MSDLSAFQRKILDISNERDRAERNGCNKGPKLGTEGGLMHRNVILLLLLLIWLMSGQQLAIAEIYKWTNADGTIGFTDDPAKVPEKYRKQASQKKDDDSEGRVYISKPASKGSAAASGYVEPEKNPEKQMTEEEKKKVEAETRAVWEKMKKALSEKQL